MSMDNFGNSFLALIDEQPMGESGWESPINGTMGARFFIDGLREQALISDENLRLFALIA